MTDSSYIPPLRYSFLTGLYDPIVQATLRERAFKSSLIQQSQLQASQRALDLGCGTGTLTLMMKTFAPQAEIVGLDADSGALALAKSKVCARIASLSNLTKDLRPSCPTKTAHLITFSLAFSSIISTGMAKQKRSRKSGVSCGRAQGSIWRIGASRAMRSCVLPFWECSFSMASKPRRTTSKACCQFWRDQPDSTTGSRQPATLPYSVH